MATQVQTRAGVMRRVAIGAAAAALVVITAATPNGATPKFFDDDPLAREPETQDASKVTPWSIDLFVDLTSNLFGHPGDPAPNVRARDVNTVDEVPDSSWFTNRIGAGAMPLEAIVRGPVTGAGPAPGPWTVIRPKTTGFSPGFTMRDAQGETWFVSFDSPGFPEAATGAVMAANKIFWTLGYFQVENHLALVTRDRIQVGDGATIRLGSDRRRPMRAGDIDDILRRSHRNADGTYRAVAGRILPGRILGGFRYHGTRPDDPNDIVAHEHRRVLRALKVFGAWTNLVDMKAGNTLDTLVTADGRSLVRHYLQDVGSTFGTGALGPREYDEGYEFLYEGGPLLARLFTLGLALPRWATVDYEDQPLIGRFEGKRFDPARWRPRVPTAAFLRARADDDFWAARRVAAFSDEAIRALVKTAGYSDPAAEQLLADVLIQRRDAIARTFLPAINPVVDVTMAADGTVTFGNAAVTAGVAPAPPGYSVRWAGFDNATGTATPIGAPVLGDALRVAPPSALPAAPGGFVQVSIAATGGPRPWATPVQAWFRRAAAAWRLVGFERLP